MSIFTITYWNLQNNRTCYHCTDDQMRWSSSLPVLGSPKWQPLLLGWSSESCIAQRKCEMWKGLESSQALRRKTGANHGSVRCTSTESTCENFLLDTIWFNRATLVKNDNSYNKGNCWNKWMQITSTSDCCCYHITAIKREKEIQYEYIC